MLKTKFTLFAHTNDNDSETFRRFFKTNILLSFFLKITMNASRIPVIRWQVVVTVLEVTCANAGLVTREMASTARVRCHLGLSLTL